MLFLFGAKSSVMCTNLHAVIAEAHRRTPKPLFLGHYTRSAKLTGSPGPADYLSDTKTLDGNDSFCRAVSLCDVPMFAPACLKWSSLRLRLWWNRLGER
jgi:hypothetical protein